MGDHEDAQFVPISVLNTFVTDWTFKAKVVRITSREYNNAKGPGKLMNLDLIDKHNTMIQATLFNEGVDRFRDVIATDKVYTFSNGQVKLANKRFTSIPNDFCVTMDQHAKIEEVVDVDPNKYLREVSYNFITIKQISESNTNEALVDVIGVITEVHEV